MLFPSTALNFTAWVLASSWSGRLLVIGTILLDRKGLSPVRAQHPLRPHDSEKVAWNLLSSWKYSSAGLASIKLSRGW